MTRDSDAVAIGERQLPRLYDLLGPPSEEQAARILAIFNRNWYAAPAADTEPEHAA